ncbi:hypothetical protein WR25_02564 [Diploscapter pachys]|uniref:phosphoribosylglycinamide formyltransferase 1 n=1 Tax=Diploscapter pachys TaxID=2018661 RepID=A0A2A2K9W4_9BILA|nr:hypothetical protein WR25_02564 [Diploscapter pachys]
MVKLIEYSKRRASHYEVVLVISNKPNAGGIEKAKQMGIPVEIVENTKEEVDHGKILAQEAVQIGENDTAETLHAAIQAEEYKLFPIATDNYAAKLLEEI